MSEKIEFNIPGVSEEEMQNSRELGKKTNNEQMEKEKKVNDDLPKGKSIKDLIDLATNKN